MVLGRRLLLSHFGLRASLRVGPRRCFCILSALCTLDRYHSVFWLLPGAQRIHPSNPINVNTYWARSVSGVCPDANLDVRVTDKLKDALWPCADHHVTTSLHQSPPGFPPIARFFAPNVIRRALGFSVGRTPGRVFRNHREPSARPSFGP